MTPATKKWSLYSGVIVLLAAIWGYTSDIEEPFVTPGGERYDWQQSTTSSAELAKFIQVLERTSLWGIDLEKMLEEKKQLAEEGGLNTGRENNGKPVYSLIGVASDEGVYSAFLLKEGDSKPIELRLDKILENGTRIISMSDDEIELEVDGEVVILRLYSQKRS